MFLKGFPGKHTGDENPIRRFSFFIFRLAKTPVCVKCVGVAIELHTLF